MLENVERSDVVEKLISERQFPSVIKLACGTNLFRPLDIWFRYVHAVSFKTVTRQASDDLAYTATDIKRPCTRLFRTKCVGIFGVKILVPTGQEFCIGFILAIRVLMTH